MTEVTATIDESTTTTLLSNATTEPDWTASVPDKFKADGQINHQAIYTGYQELESRMRDTGFPPKEIAEYAFDYPEGMTDDLKMPAADLDGLKQFAFDKGLTQKQFSETVNAWQTEKASLRQSIIDEFNLNPDKQVESARETLLADFKDQATLDKNLTQAAKALIKIVPNAELRSAISDTLGNDPNLIKALAQFGATLHEDGPLPPANSLPAQDVTKLMANPAFRNPHHPEHALIKAQVDAYYAGGGQSIRQR